MTVFVSCPHCGAMISLDRFLQLPAFCQDCCGSLDELRELIAQAEALPQIPSFAYKKIAGE